tara:strand:+ start:1210 stop:2055 length:846 start_codon:yes stop_codon:yes gene_type:complete
MAQGRHSYVRFFPSDWLGGTARMTRTHRSVYFDVCCYQWDHNLPCPASELPLMLGDLPNWRELVEDLVLARKLIRDEDGALSNPKAAAEAKLAFDLWEKKSTGGKNGAAKTNAKDAADTPDGTPDSTPDGSGDGSSRKTTGSPDAEPEPELEPYLREDVEWERLENPDLVRLANLVSAASGIIIDAAHRDYPRQVELIKGWVEVGATPGLIRETIADVLPPRGQTISSIAYFDKAIRQAVARRENQTHGTSRTRTEQPAKPMVGAVAQRQADRAARRANDV